jgi:hypothetical protein
MNTKNIGVMDWDSIIQLLIFHIKNGKKVNVNIYGDNLSFTFDSKNFCFEKTFIVKIEDTYDDNYGNYPLSSLSTLSSMLGSVLEKQLQKQITSKITYHFDRTLVITMNNRQIYNIMFPSEDNVNVSYSSVFWSWPSHDGYCDKKVGVIGKASKYLFNEKV